MLTGKTRMRLHHRLFRPPVLVLQVQFRTRVYDGSPAGVAVFQWRDAKTEDLKPDVD